MQTFHRQGIYQINSTKTGGRLAEGLEPWLVLPNGRLMDDDPGARKERHNEGNDEEAQRNPEGDVERRIIDHPHLHEAHQGDERVEGCRSEEPAPGLGSHGIQ
jgi:hypothetical protein